MNGSSVVRASHVNSGTSIPREELPEGPARGPVLRHPKLQAEVEPGETTSMGGLALAVRLVSRLGLQKLIDDGLSLLQVHRPYCESDHVLTHAYNLFAGGTAIEDIADLQHSEPIRRILGAERIPDPTTSGDFLRRFDQGAIGDLDRAIDEGHKRAWAKSKGRKKRPLGVVDLDSTVRHVYGHQKEGADFTYKGGFGYHPLVISLAETSECLRLVNRSGNVTSADGAAMHLQELVPLLKTRFKRVLVRGDSAFAQQAIFDVCDAAKMHFAMVSSKQRNFEELADAIPERHWKPFRANEDRPAPACRRRQRGENRRRLQARARGKCDLKLQKQWVAEVAYKPARSDRAYRLVVRRQRIEESNQGELFELWRYRFVLTSLPRTVSTAEVVRQTYRRCDQEKVIEQLQNGVAAMKLPTGTLLANHAHLVCARLAQNMKAWLAMLALPAETLRWEWKRFRRSFVYVAARVVISGRRRILKIAASHRFADDLALGIARLQV